ncbi:MAG: glycogen synthase GlgA [Erysipelotrichaceae bacterium]|jgi:starch synthase|nr:glycogen synthase GlgA [Erysipelotrichaceae bacterium]
MKKKKILFAAAESLPFVKSGGLADVVGSLPQQLDPEKFDVRVCMPLFLKVAQKWRPMLTLECKYEVPFGQFKSIATVYSLKEGHVTFYFIEHQGYFEREGLYGYGDDGERFAFYQWALLRLLPELGWFPDILHAHDWHAGMLAFLCKCACGFDKRYQKIKHLYTIHNLAYQGIFPKEVLGACFGQDDTHYNDGSLKMHEGISFMKAGIIYSDRISTVSKTYAKEILSTQFGENLEGVLSYRQADLSGIVNGIDTALWDPQSDALLIKNYGIKTYKSGKAANKKALQQELGLRVAGDVLLVGMVSRLTWQKGVYLISEKMSDIMGQDLQLIILGTGEAHAENSFRYMEDHYKRRAVYYCGYNEELAHRIYAGADLFLMPSLFEPCGISQMIAQRYGCLPLVREVGGLKDTVQPVNEFEGTGNGFSFALFNGNDLVNILGYAAYLYYVKPKLYQKLIENAMATDVSWQKSAREYEALYLALSK